MTNAREGSNLSTFQGSLLKLRKSEGCCAHSGKGGQERGDLQICSGPSCHICSQKSYLCRIHHAGNDQSTAKQKAAHEFECQQQKLQGLWHLDDCSAGGFVRRDVINRHRSRGRGRGRGRGIRTLDEEENGKECTVKESRVGCSKAANIYRRERARRSPTAGSACD